MLHVCRPTSEVVRTRLKKLQLRDDAKGTGCHNGQSFSRGDRRKRSADELRAQTCAATPATLCLRRGWRGNRQSSCRGGEGCCRRASSRLCARNSTSTEPRTANASTSTSSSLICDRRSVLTSIRTRQLAKPASLLSGAPARARSVRVFMILRCCVRAYLTDFMTL
jgi:hypothetical protein